jgi:hypothetical protein
MPTALDQHCCPDTVANAFTTIMSLFNDVQGNSELIMEFCSCFDGMVMDMMWCKIVIPPILLVMFFLCALHGHYTDLLKQFCSRFKVLEDASVDSVVKDVHYHNSFTLAGPKKSTPPQGSRVLKASAANADMHGHEWNNPFEWLLSYSKKGIKTRWTCALAGMGICPICHSAKKPWHVPVNCPLLKELNLKLIKGPPSAPSPAPAPASLAAAPTPAPSPGGHAALTTGPPNGSTGSSSAPSGLMALLAKKYDALVEEYESEKDFHWAGDEDVLAYDSPPASSCNCNNLAAFYPSCNHTATMPLFPSASSNGLPVPAALASCSMILQKCLQAIIAWMTKDSISPGLGCRFLVADTGATDHMFPNKLAFISYTSIPNLHVPMGNNSCLPVLGRGTTITSLNDQCVLVSNTLHVPGLAVLLYSLRAHLKQHGCGFLGTFKAGMLVYFPWFVLLVDTSSNCHLSYEPLGWAAPLDTLHYVQPYCPPSLYL